MPEGKASTDDLYAQALAAREQSQLLVEELQAAKRKTQESWQLIQEAWDQTQAIHARRLVAGADPDRLRHSAYARLQARLASMPVIEQAKGIIMAQYGCAEDQAFDVLRRASQRGNVKVRELAASIVARAARSVPARRQAGPASTTRQPDGEPIPLVGSGNSPDRRRASA